MPEIDISINGRSYRIACEEGEEEHLSRLGAFIDERVEGLAARIGQVGDARLLVMAGLMIADELAEAYATLSEAGLATAEDDDPQAAAAGRKQSLAARIEDAAARIESIAEAIQRS